VSTSVPVTNGQSTSSQLKRRQKDRLYALFARVATAMANPHRLELVDLLAHAPRTVEELAREANMTVANTSQHLQRLKQARLVSDTREGLYVRYRLADPAVARLWLELRGVAERQLAEVEAALDDYRDRRHEFQAISAEELRERLRRSDVILLDVRPQEEYQAGHIPGAISMPHTVVEDRLAELPTDKTIVAYCRGPYCVYADDALNLLAIHGLRVARLEVGPLEWQAAAPDR